MTQNADTDLKQSLTPDEYSTLQQGVEQDNARALQEGRPNANIPVEKRMAASYPNWPTSIPGPQTTQPPPGLRTVGSPRSEQYIEVGYDQVTGTPSTEDAARYLPDSSMEGRTSFDQLETTPAPQTGPRRRKDRIE